MLTNSSGSMTCLSASRTLSSSMAMVVTFRNIGNGTRMNANWTDLRESRFLGPLRVNPSKLRSSACYSPKSLFLIAKPDHNPVAFDLYFVGDCGLRGRHGQGGTGLDAELRAMSGAGERLLRRVERSFA